MNCRILLTGLWVMLATPGGAQTIDNSAILLHPDRYKGLAEIKGKILAVDQSSHQITLEDSSQQKVTVIVSQNTRVTDAGNHAFNWMSLRTGDPVRLYYEPTDRVALQIDREATTAEGILGIEHPETK